MGTDWKFICTGHGCKNAKGWGDGAGLFVTLKAKAEKQNFPDCNECGSRSDIVITLGFGLYGKVLHSFYPSSRLQRDSLEWRGPHNQKWTYYPFLVMIDPVDKDQWGKGPYSWQPYWHVVGSKEEKKYGQWAQCLDIEILADLLRQAREVGYRL